jgi:YD repeat-containing protein
MGTGAIATTSMTYDVAGEVTAINHTSGGAGLSSFTYNYNAAGLVTSENDSGSLQTYTYDATNQGEEKGSEGEEKGSG